MRVDPVLITAVALVLGATASVSAAPAVGTALIAVGLLGSRLGWRSSCVAVLAFAVGFARGAHTLHHFENERVAARDAIGGPQRCSLTARVASSPVWAGGSASYAVELLKTECGERVLPPSIGARLHGGPSQLARGDRIEAVADLAPVQLFRNLGAADPTPSAARQGVVLTGGVLSLDVIERAQGFRALVDGLRARARQRIVLTFAPAAVGMARALVLGENDLPPEDASAFQKSGLSHMLAVSGTHLVFAVLALVRGLGFVLVRVQALAARYDVGRAAAAIGALLALIYADFAGGSGSAWRAAFMLSAGLLARACGRRPSTPRAFGLSIAVFAAFDPLCAFDLSFMLSVAATLGLLWLGRPLAAQCEKLRSPVLRALSTSLVATVSASIPCAPLLALLASGITLAGLVANIVAAPFGEAIALPLCLGHTLLEPFPVLERGVALVASGALLVVKRIAHMSAAASFLALQLPEPSAYQLAVVGVGVLCVVAAPVVPACSVRRVYTLRGGLIACAILAFACLEYATRAFGRPSGVLRVTALDVGQGDANLVDLPNSALLLVDGGGFVGSPVDPGKAVILPVLRARRRTRLDLVVLSHPHPDHFTGLLSALSELEVGEFWDSGQGEAEGAGPIYAELIQMLRRRGVPIRHPSELCSAPHAFGAATIQLLAPCPTFVPHRGANDNSLVLRIQYGRRSVLLTGDAEAEEEGELLRLHPNELRADYLKVGHHGSRTSTSEPFLAAVSPLLATMSCGVRNRFGHPHAPTVERLAAHAVRALRLDRSGSVIFETDGVGARVRAFGAER